MSSAKAENLGTELAKFTDLQRRLLPGRRSPTEKRTTLPPPLDELFREWLLGTYLRRTHGETKQAPAQR
jgi:hypothetical protein